MPFRSMPFRAAARATTVAALLACAAATTIGCGGGISATGGDADFKTRRAMGTLASFYGDYLGQYGAPPKDEATFRKFLDERKKGIERMGLDGVDGLLKSPRDGQPLIVVYGKKKAPASSPNTPWACYEQTGVDGKRMAAQVRGPVDELTSEEIAKQIAPPTK